MPIKMRNIFVQFYLQQEVLSKAYARCLVFQVDSAWIVTCFLGRTHFQGAKWLWQLLQPPAAKVEILLPCESDHRKDCIKNSKDFSEHTEIAELEPNVKNPAGCNSLDFFARFWWICLIRMRLGWFLCVRTSPLLLGSSTTTTWWEMRLQKKGNTCGSWTWSSKCFGKLFCPTGDSSHLMWVLYWWAMLIAPLAART